MKLISHPFWEDLQTVKKFAERDADHRLIELLPSYKQPADTTVLDLGCAGGRNTVILAKMGFDLYAIDASKAMVDETKNRVADILGKEETQNRIRVRSMSNLSVFENEIEQQVATKSSQISLIGKDSLFKSQDHRHSRWLDLRL